MQTSRSLVLLVKLGFILRKLEGAAHFHALRLVGPRHWGQRREGGMGRDGDSCDGHPAGTHPPRVRSYTSLSSNVSAPVPYDVRKPERGILLESDLSYIA